MPLVPLASADRTALRWLRIADTPMEFALESGDLRATELRWSRAGGSLASAETADGTWTLKRAGFLNPRVTIRPSGKPTDIGRITAHLNYHRIELRGGRAFRFHRAGYLVPAWKISLDDGRELVHVEPVREGRRLAGGAVVVSPLGTESPDLLLLVVASWYFIVQAWFEDEALVPLEGPDLGADGPAGAH